ncbi:MAG: biliverdin-producing heme oxygenase [Pseudomonadota bacterium]
MNDTPDTKRDDERPIRERLRADTAESHNRIDRRLGALDLGTVDGLSRLLGAHHLVQARLDPLCDPDPRPGFVEALGRDLQALGRPVPVWRDPPDTTGLHPLGYRYVVTGSQMGARLLHRDWSRATDPHVRAAGAWMEANRQSRAWPELLGRLRGLVLSPGEADHVVTSADRVFRIYDRAATELGVDAAS